MPLLVPFNVIEEIQKITKMEVAPYVSPFTEVKKIIENKYPETAAPLPKGDDGDEISSAMEEDWEKLFDEADESVQKPPQQPTDPN